MPAIALKPKIDSGRDLNTERALVLPNPKKDASKLDGRTSWYPYYAGYSPVFVQRVLEQSKLQKNSLILDPWNGSGTTTQIAYELGYSTVGFDLNPVVGIVAAAKLLDTSRIKKIAGPLTALLEARKSQNVSVGDDDPLVDWLSPEAVRSVRKLESILQEFGPFHETPVKPGHYSYILPAESAFLYVALFRALRSLLKGFRSSNPTWLRRPRSLALCVNFDFEELVAIFLKELATMVYALRASQTLPRMGGTAKVGIASSDRLPLADSTASLVISSPPYCTRIDYAISTSIELAVLGYHPEGSLRDLRDRMIGTSTIRKVTPSPQLIWGSTCLTLLGSILEHDSKASKSYYLKNHTQYFSDMYISLSEIDRCLKPTGQCVLVVQDSHYKNLHNDLPTIMKEMAHSLCWQLSCRRDFPVSRTMVGINSKAKRYNPLRSATESVLWFSKA